MPQLRTKLLPSQFSTCFNDENSRIIVIFKNLDLQRNGNSSVNRPLQQKV